MYSTGLVGPNLRSETSEARLICGGQISVKALPRRPLTGPHTGLHRTVPRDWPAPQGCTAPSTRSSSDCGRARGPPTPRATLGRPPLAQATARGSFSARSASLPWLSSASSRRSSLTARLYGVQIIGSFALVSVPVAALWILSTVKEQQALIKEVTGLPARHPRVTQLFAAVFTFSSGLTAVVAMLDIVVCWFVFRGPLHAPELIVPAFANIAGYAVVTNTGWNIDSIFSAFVAGRQIFWVRLHEVLSFIVIAMAVGFAWRSVWGLVIAMIGASATSLVHRMIAVRPFVRARLRLGGISHWIATSAGPAALRPEGDPGSDCAGRQPGGRHMGPRDGGARGHGGCQAALRRSPERLQQASMRITESSTRRWSDGTPKATADGFDRALIDSIRYEMIGCC